jgi:hypothetical protein
MLIGPLFAKNGLDLDKRFYQNYKKFTYQKLLLIIFYQQ